MSVLADLGLGTVLTAVFWGYISTALLDVFKVYTGSPLPFIAGGLGFLWGYGLEHLAKQASPHRKNGLILAGWLAPVLVSGTLQAIVWLKPEVLPWNINISEQAPIYLVLWALCSVQGINRARSYKLATSQRNSLLGTLALALLASFKLSQTVNLATGALFFALVSTLDIALVRQGEVLRTVQSGQRRYWTAGGVGFLALILATAAFVSVGVPGTVSLIRNILAKAWSLISALIIYAAIPIGWLAEWLVMRLRQMLNLDPHETQELPPFRRHVLEQLQEEGSLAELPPWAYAILIGTTVAAVLWLIWRFVLKRGAAEKQDSQLKETRTSLLEKEALRDWAKNAMDEILSRMKANVTRTIGAILPGKPRNIQELYSRSLEVLGRQVFPRKESDTPLEYLEDILEHVPTDEGRMAFDYITELFCRCHYSNKQPDTSEWEKAVYAYSVLIQPETFRLQPQDTD